MKVLIVGNDTTYIYNLRDVIIQRLLETGNTVTIVSQVKMFETELRMMGCAIRDINISRQSKNPLYDIGFYIKLSSIISEEAPDAVLTFNIKPNVYAGMICSQKHIPYISNITGLGTAVEYPGVLQKISIHLYRIGIKNAFCVFFQNRENMSFFYNHHVLDEHTHYTILPGSGVNLERHKVLEYPSDNDAINFLFIARVMKEKGIDQYLDAAKYIKSKYPKCNFHICGACDDKSYNSLLSFNRTVIYHGEQKDLINYYNDAHCIIHPSYYPEGMSNVLLEAAAHARPIITTDKSGCKEIVEDGQNGYIVPMKDSIKLIEKIEQFIALDWHQKRNMGLIGRAKIEQQFDRQFVANQYIQELMRLNIS